MAPGKHLAQLSPKLHAALRRHFADNYWAFFEFCGENAHQQGGQLELDYLRPEGMSFNPRWARIACISLDTARRFRVEEIAAAMLVGSDLAEDVAKQELLLQTAQAASAPIAELTDRSLGVLARITLSPSEIATSEFSRRVEIAEIALARWLDRLRHLHLADKNRLRSCAGEMAAVFDSYVELALTVNSPQLERLRNWDRTLLTDGLNSRVDEPT